MPICICKARGGHQESSSILAGWLLVDLTQFRQVRAFRETASIRMICRQERLCDTFSISLSPLPRGWPWTAGDPLPQRPQCQDSWCVPPHSAQCRHLSLCHQVPCRPPAPMRTATVSLRGSDPSRGLPVAFSPQAWSQCPLRLWVTLLEAIFCNYDPEKGRSGDRIEPSKTYPSDILLPRSCLMGHSVWIHE